MKNTKGKLKTDGHCILLAGMVLLRAGTCRGRM